MTDLFEKCANWMEPQMAKLSGNYPLYRVIEQNDGTEVTIGGKRLIMACSNNYMGLANDPRVREAAAEAARKWGASTCGSPILNGTLSLHDELNHRLAKFLKKEAAICFSTGFQANVGAISALATRRDVIFADRMVHASIVQGTMASYGETKRFRHNDMEDLERIMAATDPEVGKLIVVDGVYSMEGDLADLPSIAALARKHGARLMVDEAHGFGVLGECGRGTGEHFGVENEVDVVMTTFSKSLASIGGVIAGRADVIEWIKHKGRALCFSASMTPSAAAAALKALEIIEKEPERRQRLWDISERAHRELRALGFNTHPSVTPVIPIVVGDQMANFDFWRKLTDAGLFVSAVPKPAVEQPMVRMVFMATHTDEQVERALEMVKTCGRQIGLIPYEKPHTTVEVKMARPGLTGFYSSNEGDKTEHLQLATPEPDLAQVLLNAQEPLSQRITDAAGILARRALNAGPNDVITLAKLPQTIWRQRRRIRNRLLSMGVEWMSRRQDRGHGEAEQ